MAKNVLIVGHCGIDGPRIEQLVRNLDPSAHVVRPQTTEELERALKDAGGSGLLLFNRELVGRYNADEGVDLIRQLRPKLPPECRMVLVSDYEDAQAAAVEAGAERGFGKRDLGSPEVADFLRGALQ